MATTLQIEEACDKLTGLLCRVAERPDTEAYTLDGTTVHGGYEYKLRVWVPPEPDDLSFRKGEWIHALSITFPTKRSCHVQRITVSQPSSEQIELTGRNRREVMRSFVLGRYITVLRPLEGLFAHETAVEELSEWTNGEDD
jgi:hypothetical protein